MSLGKRIQSARIAKGLTQKQLADAVGINQKNISFYERELGTPSAVILKDIAVVLEADIYYLLEIDRTGITDTPLMKLLKELDTLPEKEKNTVMGLIENFLEVNRLRGKKKK